jgi:hypothetical protein
MRIFSICVLALVGSASQALFPPAAVACSCRVPSFDYAYHHASAIFVGTAKQVQRFDRFGPAKMTMQVEMSWRGVFESEVDIWTGNGYGDCGYVFKPGDKYLVFADQLAGDGSFGLKTWLCSRTGPVARKTGDIVSIASLRSFNYRRGSKIYGSVSKQIDHEAVRIGGFVNAENRGKIRTVQIGPNGMYEFVGLKSGSYRIFLTPIPGMNSKESAVYLEDDQHFVRQDLIARENPSLPR